MKLMEKNAQLILNFEAGVVDSYHSCREYVQARVHQQPKLTQGGIAQKMDMAPSKLTRKLAHTDTSRFTLDDFENFIQVTNDKKPLLYLVEKYLMEVDDAEIDRQVEELLAKKRRKRR